MLREDRTDGVDRVVAIETFCLQSLQRVYRGWQLVRELAFDDAMNQGMQRSLRQMNSRPSMIVFDERDLLTFIEREPLSQVGLNSGIVFHIECLAAFYEVDGKVANSKAGTIAGVAA